MSYRGLKAHRRVSSEAEGVAVIPREAGARLFTADASGDSEGSAEVVILGAGSQVEAPAPLPAASAEADAGWASGSGAPAMRSSRAAARSA